MIEIFAFSQPSSAEISSVPDSTPQTNGVVFEVLPVGNRIYIGGEFSEVGGVPRNNVAAIDASTGRVVSDWKPDVNGRINTLATSQDGSRIFAGGVFTQINGSPRNRAAAISTSTGELDSQWRAGASHTVRALAVSGNNVYMGGDFATINGASREFIAKVDANTGNLDTGWSPSPNNSVRQLAFSQTDGRLFAGGDFSSVSGQSRSRLASIDPATGTVTSWRPTVATNGGILAMRVIGNRVYTAEAGPGGAGAAYDVNTGNRAWRLGGDGDGQAITVMDGKAYIGGHFINFNGQRRPFFAAANATSGVLDPDWAPSGGGGKLSSTYTTGVWTYATDTSRGRLYAGTNFAEVSGLPRRGFVQFSDSNVPPDTTPPVVNDTSPQDDERNVGVSADIEALFSEGMDPATIDDSSFTLTKEGATETVNAVISYDGISDKATLNPVADLDAGLRYTARITTRVKDASGNALTQNKAWSFRTAPPSDTTAPETNIDSGPSGTTNTDSASFVFSSSETGSTFECSLDNAAFENCSSPKDYMGLSDGDHTFRVRATDSAGNTDTSPAQSSWRVVTDVSPPETTIDSGPSGTTNTDSATFEFSSSESGSTFECSLDAGPFSDCTSPREYAGLSDGDHTLQVRATDSAGNTDATPAERTWSIDTTPPPDTTPPETSIDSGPSGTAKTAVATFEFSSSEADSTFECSVDGTPFESCTSPKEYTGLSDGDHTFLVRATDAVGNTDATPEERNWSVDTTTPPDDTPPETIIDSGPSETVNTDAATFEFSSSEANSTFECSLDDGAFETCTSPKEYTGISDGFHTFKVKATDSAGNVDATPAETTWEIDKIPPDTNIDSGPSGTTNTDSATFEFSSSESGSTFECSLDSAAFESCLSPRGYAGLSDGDHTLQVRATDSAGNTDATPAERTWNIDTTPPNSNPVVRAAEEEFIDLSNVGTSYIFVNIRYSATDPDGISSYRLQQSINGGNYTDVNLPSPTSTVVKLKLKPGSVYQYRVSATDTLGNTSDWVVADPFAVKDYQETSPDISYTGTWTSQLVSSAYGGSLKYTSGAGSQSASISFTGSDVVWVAPKGLDRGKANVYLDGVLVDTPDLYNSKNKPRMAVYVASLPYGVHTLEIKALGTKRSASNGTRIDLDAFFVLD